MKVFQYFTRLNGGHFPYPAPSSFLCPNSQEYKKNRKGREGKVFVRNDDKEGREKAKGVQEPISYLRLNSNLIQTFLVL